MRGNKTIRVRIIKEQLNIQLASNTLTRDQKSVVSGILSNVLKESNNYYGFGFLQNMGPNAVEETPRPNEDGYYNRRYY